VLAISLVAAASLVHAASLVQATQPFGQTGCELCMGVVNLGVSASGVYDLPLLRKSVFSELTNVCQFMNHDDTSYRICAINAGLAIDAAMDGFDLQSGDFGQKVCQALQKCPISDTVALIAKPQFVSGIFEIKCKICEKITSAALNLVRKFTGDSQEVATKASKEFHKVCKLLGNRESCKLIVDTIAIEFSTGTADIGRVSQFLCNKIQECPTAPEPLPVVGDACSACGTVFRRVVDTFVSKEAKAVHDVAEEVFDTLDKKCPELKLPFWQEQCTTHLATLRNLTHTVVPILIADFPSEACQRLQVCSAAPTHAMSDCDLCTYLVHTGRNIVAHQDFSSVVDICGHLPTKSKDICLKVVGVVGQAGLFALSPALVCTKMDVCVDPFEAVAAMF